MLFIKELYEDSYTREKNGHEKTNAALGINEEVNAKAFDYWQPAAGVGMGCVVVLPNPPKARLEKSGLLNSENTLVV